MNDHPKPLKDFVELEMYRKKCELNCHPNGQCDNWCHASDYYYKTEITGIWPFKKYHTYGQWYCRASPTLEEFEPDYRKEKK